MPAIWSSSERPISVRTVWVDGVRHAILSQDDPLLNNTKALRRRPQTTSAAVKDQNYPIKFEPYKPGPQRTESVFDSCFVKLRLVVEKSAGGSSSGGESSGRSLVIRRQSAPICARISRINGLEFRGGGGGNLFDCERVPRSGPFLESGSPEGLVQEEREEPPKQRTETPQLNTLSERVLQWLDLSGKVQDYELEEADTNDSEEQEEEEEEKPAARRKHSACKLEPPPPPPPGSCLKVQVLPTQYLVLQELRTAGAAEAAALESCERRYCKRKLAAKSRRRETRGGGGKEGQCRKMSAGCKSSELACKPKVELEEQLLPAGTSSARSHSMWTPPGKPQLHIFMPSLQKPTEIHWMSSQESLFCD